MKVYKQYKDTRYKVSECGEVFSMINNKPLKPMIINSGYLRVSILRRSELVHRLVANLFVPNPHNYPCVNHVDGDKFNNHFSNLVWCTYAQNNQHARDTGLNPRKLTSDDRSKIIEDNQAGLAQRTIAKRYGVNKNAISGVLQTFKKNGTEIRIRTRMLTDHDCSEICEASAAGISQHTIANHYGISRSTIQRVVNNKYTKDHNRIFNQ